MAACAEDLGYAPAGAGLDRAEQPATCSSNTDTNYQPAPSPSPIHPISQLQGPFEESIAEAADGAGSEWVVELDAQTRRRDLLENDEYERLCARKWRQRASERYHPFWKLVSQMVFGVHLLAKRQAKSPAAVMHILQGHVDELDGFLQRTTEDFLIIHLDVRTRIQYLSLPLGNLTAFDEMLEDRNFRLALVSYNDQIEHAVERFTQAIIDAVKDLRKAKEAMGVLWHYLLQLGNEGCFETDSLQAFYQTMMENMEGWIMALSKLRGRGAALQKALGQLAFAVTEMQRRVGVASRKDVRSLVKMANRASARPTAARQSLFTRNPGRRPLSEKPLPRDPFLQPKARPASRKLDDTLVAGKGSGDGNGGTSAPKVSKRESIMPKVISRAKSCSALVGETGSGTDDTAPPRTPSRLTRKLSRPFLPKRSVSEKIDTTTTNRPSTAPVRTLKSRSASIEGLKVLWANGRPRAQQSMAKPPTQARPQTSQHQHQHQQQPDGLDTLKDQISHFLKTDRVVEAWDNITKSANCCGTTLAKTKEWPSSIFRAKSTESFRARPSNGLSGADLERQMSWVQEPEFLNTYSLKQRPATSPRIHVLSIALDEELDGGFGVHVGDDVGEAGETGSIITALPAVPPPTPATIKSVAAEERPRTVAAQA
ncbi:uncharacterized protein N7482_010206 [Penicillium canariense]|uniref:Uncharacterized protein n=1 Tax=Penicillium canariense TaxID=189055 RepID=A0A9W9LDU6_9EURO|nr:uncharacterized protein N7482_010206 [Penicillium canariense]KAJ5150954.1 hypothetical protein N7482_010206 [Penicillium canariense]